MNEYAEDVTTVSITDSNMRLLWVHGGGGTAHLLQELGAAVLAVEDQVIGLYFQVDDAGEVALGAYLDREK